MALLKKAKSGRFVVVGCRVKIICPLVKPRPAERLPPWGVFLKDPRP